MADVLAVPTGAAAGPQREVRRVSDTTIPGAVDGEATRTTIDATAQQWGLPAAGSTIFDFDYTNGRDQLLRLYDKGTRRQWVASDRIDWTVDVDWENPLGVPDESISIVGTRYWERMNARERGEVRRHQVAWQFSQFLHGEQGALMCASKIVNTVPTIDAKFYAATQVVDEARHVEVFGRYLYEKLDLVYPLNRNLRSLLDDALTDARWDMTYLAMQVLIEGLALAAFALIRNNATDPLAQSINAYVMQDEARHVMFGRLALRDYYPELTAAERDEREEFCVDACYRMRDRFLAEEVWERLGLPAAAVVEEVKNSELQLMFRGFLFTRIVPVLRDIGLWGPRIRAAFEDMGVIGFADADLDALVSEDEAFADRLDQQRLDAVRTVAHRD
jgi:hypothetical protein